MKEKFSKFYLILKVSTYMLLKCVFIHINTKFQSSLQYHQKHFPMSLLIYSFNFLFNLFSFKSAISLTFVLMCPHRKNNQLAPNLESVVPKKLDHLYQSTFHEIFHLIMYELLWKNGAACHLTEKSSYYCVFFFG